jgi:hypothetical protein
MKMKKPSIILIVAVMIVFSTLTVSLFTSENASAHAPSALYPTYKEGTLTVYIDHPSDDPDTHYIETVTVTVNRVEVLSESYTSQTTDGGKGMVTYSYTLTASDGDVISVTAECSIDGSATETLTVGEGGSKDDPKDDPKDEPKNNTSSSISGTVTDTKTREPVTGAEVTIYDQVNRENYNQTITDDQGYYKLGGNSGNYTISISKDGYDSYKETVKIEGQVEHNVQLTPVSDGVDDPNKNNLSSVSGIVTNAKTREPIVEATVYIYAEKSKDNYQKTQTDRGGNYEITIEPGIYTISISKDGYAGSTEIVNIDGRAEHNVQLTPGGDNGGKDDPKDYPPKDGDPKDDSDIVGDSNPDEKSGQDDENIIFLLGAIIGVLVVIVVLIAMLLKKQKGTPEKGTAKKDKVRKDEWTTCPKCGSSIRMGQLSSHLDAVHPKLTKKTKEKMIEDVIKRR